MANRTMQAKSLKLKRQRRLFPKHMSASYIPVGMPPNRLVMQEYKERTKSLAFDDKYMAWLELIARFRGKPPGKVEAEAAWARIRDASPHLMRVRLSDKNDKTKEVWMYFNSERTQNIIYEENYVGRFIRASIRYQCGERAKARFVAGSVNWVECVSCSPVIE